MVAYTIDNSLIFNDADSAYLSRTPASAGDQKTFTFSTWVKRSDLGVPNYIFDASVDSTNIFYMSFRTTDDIQVLARQASGASKQILTNAVYRDVSAWYHILLAVDTTQSTASNRLRLYINGDEVTSFATDDRSSIAQNSSFTVNSTAAHHLNKYGLSASYGGVYRAEPILIDGQQLTPSDFGETDANNQWVPKAYAGSYGTNGFFLDFEDDTSAATLGYDVSGNDNHWTPSGITTSDQTTDTPTNNHCVLNSIDEDSQGTLSNGNLVVTGTTHQLGTIGVSSGKYAWKFIADATGSFGIEDSGETETTTSVTSADVVEFELDMDAGTLKKRVNGGALTSVATGLTGTQFPLFKAACTCDFGQKTFTPTDGTFKPLNTNNLPEPSNLVDDMYKGVTATEANIESDLATVRSGWTNWVDIKKNRDASETWSWIFSHDSSNEHSLSTTGTYAAKRTLSGSNAWVGHSIRIGSTYDTAAGSASHTNGTPTTVTHNLGESRAFILLFSRSDGEVYAYHPDLTAGKLIKITDNAAETTGTQITSITSNAFDIGSAHATATYDYLVLAKSDVIKLASWGGNGSADGPMVNSAISSLFKLSKRIDAAANLPVIDNARSSYNVVDTYLLAAATNVEATADMGDFLSNGFKVRTTSNLLNTSGGSYVSLAIGQPFKYANAR